MNTENNASTGGTKKRKWNETDEDSNAVENPKKRCKLEAESPIYTFEDNESVYSYQSKTTATAYDTSDTSDKSDETDGSMGRWVNQGQVFCGILTRSESSDMIDEFEMVDYTQSTVSDSTSSDPQDVSRIQVVNTPGRDNEFMTDVSDHSSDSQVSNGRFIHIRLCLYCEEENDNVWLQYCSKCFKKQKSKRPPYNRKMRRTSRKQTKGAITNSQFDTPDNSDDQLITYIQTPEHGSQANSMIQNPCLICFNQPRNGVFVHRNIIHRSYCYDCAVKAWKMNRRRCPVCMQRVPRVHKDVNFS